MIYLIDFIVKPSIDILTVQHNHICLPDFRDVGIELKISGTSKLGRTKIAQIHLILTYDIGVEHFEILSFSFNNRRSAQEAKHYFENNLKQEIEEEFNFPIPFKDLAYIENEKFEDIGEDEVIHEVSHYALKEHRLYLSEKPHCADHKNEVFEFKHQFEIN